MGTTFVFFLYSCVDLLFYDTFKGFLSLSLSLSLSFPSLFLSPSLSHNITYTCYFPAYYEIELFTCIKMDLALNNPQWLMCHKTKVNQRIMIFSFYLIGFYCATFNSNSVSLFRFPLRSHIQCAQFQVFVFWSIHAVAFVPIFISSILFFTS